MSELKPRAKYIPLHVHPHPTSKNHTYGREQNISINGTLRSIQSTVAEFACVSETERRTRLIRELLHLCDLLRTDASLDKMLEQIVGSIVTYTGFQGLVINVLDENEKMLRVVAAAGVTEEDHHLLHEKPFPIDILFNLMRPQFRMSQSYFIAHEDFSLLADATGVIIKDVEREKSASSPWHAEDFLLVPLYSPRGQTLLGCFSLADPEDDRIPTIESIEMLELFADKAALAIDNARLSREREQERRELEQAIGLLCEDVEALQQGDLRQHVRATDKKLQPVVDAINSIVTNLTTLVNKRRMVALAVDEQTHKLQHSSEQLINGTMLHEQQMQQLLQVISDVASIMPTISECAALLSKTAVDAVDVTVEAQTTVDRAMEGMGQVREAMMQSVRTMKMLDESSHQVNEASQIMTDLATHMHILSLNAAIEATRAGDHGQGFIHIAQEIRRLAMQCSDGTRKVGAYIHTIQHETLTLSQCVEQSTQQVILQAELVTQTGIALDAISIVTEQLTNLVQNMCTAAENQSWNSQMAINSINEILRANSDNAKYLQEMHRLGTYLLELASTLSLG
jgi:methyl-accepting chemotaxis protein